MPESIRLIECNGHAVDAVAFRSELIAWGRQHFRPLPWRLTKDPYLILMAEVMLHRTQAPQVVPLYEHLMDQCPSVSALGQVAKQELHAILYPLGLRWRIDLIHEMSTALIQKYGAQVPQQKSALLSLPGVSEYVAASVRCFAWNLPEPLIDTNTVRVVGRLFGLEIKDSSRRNRRFRELIAALVDAEQPRAHNYALLDLADQICTQKRPPQCWRCPVQRRCVFAVTKVTDANTGREG